MVEHGTFGARAAAPIAKDVMTYLFDPQTALATLAALESGWGGTPSERMAAKYRAYSAQYGTSAPKVGDEEAVKEAISSADTKGTPIETPPSNAATTRPEEPQAAPAAAPSASPAPVPTPTATVAATPAPAP